MTHLEDGYALTYFVSTVVPIGMVYVGIKLWRRDWRITKKREDSKK